jgi:uncharacterized protein (TIRG00374 family)
MSSLRPEPGGVRRRSRTWINVALSAGLLALLLWKIDLGATIDYIRDADGLLWLAALAVFVASTAGMAWRWQLLLAARGIHEPLRWLTGSYFAGYAAAQFLPTGIGGDALRIVDHARRRPDRKSEVAAAVLMERVIGAVSVLILAAVGLVLAIGRYDDIEALLWIELGFLAVVGAGLFLLFSTRGRKAVRLVRPVAARLGLQRPARSLYASMHAYRREPRALVVVCVLTLALQLVRAISIWLCGEAVGLDLSPIVYIILGPLLSLVMLVPFTVNGLGVREAFFVAFLGRFGVDADAAFATGFLFYAVTILASVPGAFILLGRSFRPMLRRRSIAAGAAHERSAEEGAEARQ